MDRERIYEDMEHVLGLVPSFFQRVPDEALEREWELFKRLQFEAGPIPQKFRTLMGIAIAAVTNCHYCGVFYDHMARLHGTSDEEIDEALQFARINTDWASHIKGLAVDEAQLEAEVGRICEHIREQQDWQSIV